MKTLKRIMIIITLIMLLSGVTKFNVNSVQAATYSSDFVSVSIPDKYEKYYESIEDDNEWVSFHNIDYTRYTQIHYDVYPKIITEYTQEYLEGYIEDLKEIYENEQIFFKHCQLIENNGCKGMRIAFTTLYSTELGDFYTYADYYYFITDNYQVELNFLTEDPNFIDSNEQKAIVNSFKIKDTVLKSRGIPFTDVATNAWYYNAVKFNYTNNMIKGLNDYTYGPSANLTRGMLVTILYRMEGSPEVTNTDNFTDVPTGLWYSKAVNWAANKKIVNGYESGKFGPEDKITREQLAVMLRSYAMYKKKDTSARTDLSKFADATKISNYAKDSVSWAVANKIISGKSNGTRVDPYGKATRAEVATMLYSYCMNIK